MSYWNKILDSIHITALTFKPMKNNTKISCDCFFECLPDLLPDSLETKAIKIFTIQNPPPTLSNRELFVWTWNLYNFINLQKKKRGIDVKDITLEQLMKKYQHVSKDDWGKVFWFLIHFTAINLPRNLTNDNKINFKAFIMSIRYNLPCDDCGNHMENYIENTKNDTNLDDYLVTNDTVFYWTWMFHNNVNERLGKPQMQLQDAKSLYLRDEPMYSFIDI